MWGSIHHYGACWIDRLTHSGVALGRARSPRGWPEGRVTDGSSAPILVGSSGLAPGAGLEQAWDLAHRHLVQLDRGL